MWIYLRVMYAWHAQKLKYSLCLQKCIPSVLVKSLFNIFLYAIEDDEHIDTFCRSMTTLA